MPPVGSGGDDDDDDGALKSASNALTDWDEPLVPGLVALVALLTLAASLVRRAPQAPPSCAAGCSAAQQLRSATQGSTTRRSRRQLTPLAQSK